MHKYSTRTYALLFLFQTNGLLLGMETSSPHKVSMQFTDKEVITNIPFPYRGLSIADKKVTTWVFDRTYTILHSNKKNFALVAPTYPCWLMALHNQENGMTWVGHAHHSNNIYEAMQNMSGLLRIKNQKSVIAQLFSKKMHPDMYNYKYRSEYAGKTQEEQGDFIKQMIIKELNLNASQVSTLLFNDTTDEWMTKSALLDGGTTNGTLNLYTICPVAEKLMSTVDPRIRDAFTTKTYGNVNEHDYMSLPFAEAPKNSCANSCV
jgi:hypothetical protein